MHLNNACMEGKKKIILPRKGCWVLSAAVANQRSASYKGRMHEYPDKGCIRITRLQLNRRGKIEESVTVTGERRVGQVIVLAGQVITRESPIKSPGRRWSKTWNTSLNFGCLYTFSQTQHLLLKPRLHDCTEFLAGCVYHPVKVMQCYGYLLSSAPASFRGFWTPVGGGRARVCVRRTLFARSPVHEAAGENRLQLYARRRRQTIN